MKRNAGPRKFVSRTEKQKIRKTRKGNLLVGKGEEVRRQKSPNTPGAQLKSLGRKTGSGARQSILLEEGSKSGHNTAEGEEGSSKNPGGADGSKMNSELSPWYPRGRIWFPKKKKAGTWKRFGNKRKTTTY